MEIRDFKNKVPAGNFKKGRCGWTPSLFVLHTTEGSYDGSCSWFCNPKSGVSAHYVIGVNGEVTQFVDIADTAYACGTSSLPNDARYYGKATNPIAKNRRANANYFAINYEIVGAYNAVLKKCSITSKQIETVIQLIAKDREEIFQKYGNTVPLDRTRICGHYEVAPIAKPFCGLGFPYDEIIKGVIKCIV